MKVHAPEFGIEASAETVLASAGAAATADQMLACDARVPWVYAGFRSLLSDVKNNPGDTELKAGTRVRRPTPSLHE